MHSRHYALYDKKVVSVYLKYVIDTIHFLATMINFKTILEWVFYEFRYTNNPWMCTFSLTQVYSSETNDISLKVTYFDNGAIQGGITPIWLQELHL